MPPVLRDWARSPWKNGVNSLSRVAPEMPGPVSATSKRSARTGDRVEAAERQAYPSFAGEFDGVLEQVDDDLPQAAWIAAHEGGELVVDVDDDLETLAVRLHREKVDGLMHPGPEVEARRLQLEPPGLDLGEVEDVVDEAQEDVGGEPDLVHVVGLLGIELRLAQELDDPEDGLDRGPDLVTHVREELALRVRGLFGLVPGLHEALLAKDPLGDVLRDEYEKALRAVALSSDGVAPGRELHPRESEAEPA